MVVRHPPPAPLQKHITSKPLVQATKIHLELLKVWWLLQAVGFLAFILYVYVMILLVDEIVSEIAEIASEIASEMEVRRLEP